MLNEKLFVVTDTGNLWERQWRTDLNRWAWQDHGLPPDTRAATSPGAVLMGSKVFVGGSNRHTFERTWTGDEWKWVDHGTALHDTAQHVIGAPGDTPALTIAVMGDGFDEGSINQYRNVVRDNVVRALGMDQLAGHSGRLRVIRIDVISPVNGVTERRYNEGGTTGDSSDDTLVSEDFRPSRLGMVATGIWSHCWIETSSFTMQRLNNLRNRFAPEATNVVIVVNSATSGGCNRGDVAAFTRGESAHVIAHELGHNLFGLGDEYHNADLAFEGTTARVNLTETPSPWSSLKWGDLVDAATPLPTDSNAVPRGWHNNTSVGAFVGGGGNYSSDIFHPAIECRMNQNRPPWCPVCAREINRFFGAL